AMATLLAKAMDRLPFVEESSVRGKRAGRGEAVDFLVDVQLRRRQQPRRIAVGRDDANDLLRVQGVEEDAVERLEMAHEKPDLPHRSHHAVDFDEIADAEGTRPQQREPSGDIAERALQSQADRNAGGAENGEKRCGLYTDLAQRGDEDENQNR